MTGKPATTFKVRNSTAFLWRGDIVYTWKKARFMMNMKDHCFWAKNGDHENELYGRGHVGSTHESNKWFCIPKTDCVELGTPSSEVSCQVKIAQMTQTTEPTGE